MNNRSERALRPCAACKITHGFRPDWSQTLDTCSGIAAARRQSIGALGAIHPTLAGTPLADST